MECLSMKRIFLLLLISSFLSACVTQPPKESPKSKPGRALESLLLIKQKELQRLKNENRVLKQSLRELKRRPAARTGSDITRTVVKNQLSEKQQFEELSLAYVRKDKATMIRAYRDLMRAFPQTIYKDKALFMMGDMSLQLREFAEALKYFRTLEADYPQSGKIPSVKLAKSKIYYQMSLAEQARVLLTELIRDYPKSPEAQSAKAELKLLDHLGNNLQR